MNDNRLSDCLENINPRFIDEAADYKKKGRGRGIYFLAAALAACILLFIATYRPYGVSDALPGGSAPVSAPVAASSVYVPAIELPEADAGFTADMLACVVYNGAVYTQGGWLDAASALVGEYLGHATGGIDEWSDESEYHVEFAGTMSGDIYSVIGYDPGFRICCLNDDGSAMLLERLNGISLDTGADLFETRLHLPERLESLTYLTHEDWNNAARHYRTPELSEERPSPPSSTSSAPGSSSTPGKRTATSTTAPCRGTCSFTCPTARRLSCGSSRAAMWATRASAGTS